MKIRNLHFRVRSVDLDSINLRNSDVLPSHGWLARTNLTDSREAKETSETFF
jgi:hypothetical protein